MLMKNIENTNSEINDRKPGHSKLHAFQHFPPAIFRRFSPNFLRIDQKDRSEGSTRSYAKMWTEPVWKILDWIIGQQYDRGIIDAFSGHPIVKQTKIYNRAECVFPQRHAFGKLREITPVDLENEKLIHSWKGSTSKDSAFFKIFPKFSSACK